jgi:hypothetical protein
VAYEPLRFDNLLMQVKVQGCNQIAELQNMANERVYNDSCLFTLFINFRESAAVKKFLGINYIIGGSIF